MASCRVPAEGRGSRKRMNCPFVEASSRTAESEGEAPCFIHPVVGLGCSGLRKGATEGPEKTRKMFSSLEFTKNLQGSSRVAFKSKDSPGAASVLRKRVRRLRRESLCRESQGKLQRIHGRDEG